MTDNVLVDYRKEINDIDSEIINLVARRYQVVKKVGEYKKLQNIEVLDKQREEKLAQFHKDIAKKYNIPEKLVLDIFELLISNSRKVQEHE